MVCRDFNGCIKCVSEGVDISDLDTLKNALEDFIRRVTAEKWGVKGAKRR